MLATRTGFFQRSPRFLETRRRRNSSRIGDHDVHGSDARTGAVPHHDGHASPDTTFNDPAAADNNAWDELGRTRVLKSSRKPLPYRHLAQVPPLAYVTEAGQIHVVVEQALVHLCHVARLGVFEFGTDQLCSQARLPT